MSGVGQRPEEIERCRHTQLPASRTGVPHRRVKRLSEAKRDPTLVRYLSHPFGAEVQPDSESLKHISRPGGRRSGPVAVLDDSDARAGGNDGRHGRDIHGVRAITACAHDVERANVISLRERHGVSEHHVRERPHLLHALPLGSQRHQEGRKTGRSCSARHRFVHRPCRLVPRQVASV